MVILPDYGRPYIIDDLSAPMIVTHHWLFSGSLQDFVLGPISYLEETTGPAIRLMIEGYQFDVPAAWNILVTDNDTYMVDTVNVAKCAGNPFYAFIMTPNDTKVRTAEITIIDYIEHASLIHPLISKGHMMCHPVGPQVYNGKTSELCCLIGPHDLQRHFSNITIGDILG